MSHKRKLQHESEEERKKRKKVVVDETPTKPLRVSDDSDKENVLTKLECGICFETINEQGVLNCCKHTFCYICIFEWSKTANTCPLCKSRFTTLTKRNATDSPTNKPGKVIKIKHTNPHFEVEDFPFEYLEEDFVEDTDENGDLAGFVVPDDEVELSDYGSGSEYEVSLRTVLRHAMVHDDEEYIPYHELHRALRDISDVAYSYRFPTPSRVNAVATTGRGRSGASRTTTTTTITTTTVTSTIAHPPTTIILLEDESPPRARTTQRANRRRLPRRHRTTRRKSEEEEDPDFVVMED